MKYRFPEMFQLKKLVQAEIAGWSVAALGLLIWAGTTILRRSCLTISNAPSNSPLCQNPFNEPVALFVAFGFWIIAVLIWLASGHNLAPAFFMTIADVLALGIVANIGNTGDLATRFFYVLLAWLGPLCLHFQYVLLDRRGNRIEQSVIFVFYGLGIIASVLVLFSIPDLLENQGLFLYLRALIRLNLILALLVGSIFVLKGYPLSNSPVVRRRIRVVTFGTLFASSPLVLLSVLPDTLGSPAHIPYAITFPLLLLSPLAYVYTLFRQRLLGSEIHFNRAAVYYMLAVLLMATFLLTASILNYFSTSFSKEWIVTSTLLSAGILLIFAPLRESLDRLIRWILYGNKVTYYSVVGQLAESLSLTSDRKLLKHLLVDEFSAAMRVSGSILFLRGNNSDLILEGMSELKGKEIGIQRLPGEGKLIAYLEKMGSPVTDLRVHREFDRVTLCAEEQAVLSIKDLAYWLPLVSAGVLQGLHLVGCKKDGDTFTLEEESILRTLAHQSGIAVHNVRLIEQVKAARHSLALAHQKLLLGQEREHHRSANELHDVAVQHLLGISYRLAEGQRKASGQDRSQRISKSDMIAMLEWARKEVVEVVKQLRELIGELRPAGLGEMGLAAALEGFVSQLEREGNQKTPQISLRIENDLGNLSESVAICLFRVIQEGVRNALRHAGARHIQISIHLNEVVELSIKDDGCGFRVPSSLGELAQQDHFGLFSMSERVEWASGRLVVLSAPGNGTELRITVPLES